MHWQVPRLWPLQRGPCAQNCNKAGESLDVQGGHLIVWPVKFQKLSFGHITTSADVAGRNLMRLNGWLLKPWILAVQAGVPGSTCEQMIHDGFRFT